MTTANSDGTATRLHKNPFPSISHDADFFYSEERSDEESEKYSYLCIKPKHSVMNLRDFKKDVEYFVGEFVDDCALFLCLNPQQDSDQIAGIIEEAVDLYNDLKDKANAQVEGSKRAYFAGLRKEMFEKVDALYERLSGIVAAAKK